MDAEGRESPRSAAVRIDVDALFNVDVVASNQQYYPQIEHKRIINQYYPTSAATPGGHKAYTAYNLNTLPWQSPVSPVPLAKNQGNNYPTSFEEYTTSILWMNAPMLAELSVGHRSASLMVNAQGVYRLKVSNPDKRARRYRIRWVEMFCPFPTGTMTESTMPANSRTLQRGEIILTAKAGDTYVLSEEFRVSPPTGPNQRGQVRMYLHNPALEIGAEPAVLQTTPAASDAADVTAAASNHRYQVRDAAALRLSSTSTAGKLPDNSTTPPAGELLRLHLDPGTQFNYIESFSTATAGRLDMDSVTLTASEGADKLRLFVQDIATAQWMELNFGDELKNPYFTNKAALSKYRFYIQAVQLGKSTLQLTTRIGGMQVMSAKMTIHSYTLSMKEVSFSGAKYWEVWADDAGVDNAAAVPADKKYEAPHWLDINGNQSPEKNVTGERNYAVAYTRNTKPEIGGKIAFDGSSPNNIKLRAIGPDGIRICSDTTYPAVVGDITVSAVPSAQRLPNTIKHYKDNFDIQWEASLDNGQTWQKIIDTHHTVYVTLGDPVTELRQETLFEIGCRNADGESLVDDVRTKIYDEFTDQKVYRLIDGMQMTYWAKGSVGAVTVENLLAWPSANGDCRAWSALLRDIFRIQGIGADRVKVEPILPQEGFVGVGKWTFNEPGFSGNYPYIYENTAFPEGSRPAQGNSDSPAGFNAHWITESGDALYDPSYGSSIKSGGNKEKEYEDSIFGVYGYVLPRELKTDPLAILIRKNKLEESNSTEVKISIENKDDGTN